MPWSNIQEAGPPRAHGHRPQIRMAFDAVFAAFAHDTKTGDANRERSHSYSGDRVSDIIAYLTQI